ncbi:MAG: aminotransferase class III-fold pyridoxal phosphate-dependent enzyme, partial [Kiloniellaceae bacterium]
TAAGRPLAAVPVDADPRQQRHLRTLARRYNRRTARSKRFAEKFRPMLADRRGAAGFRPSIKEMLYPIVGKRASGAHIWDIDDNEYVDLAMGFGVHLFGHNPAFVKRALKRQLDEGFQLGPQARRAGAVAEAIGALTGTERVVFCNSGTEAVMTALRLARTATGRSKIAMFAGAYHGHFDGTLALPRGSDGDMASTPLAPGVTPHMVEDVLVLPYGDPQSLANLRARSGELAAILVEPVQSRRPDLQPGNFLRELRRLATEAGAALIFDEILTGFRIAPGGAQEWFGVQADVATYGKLIGGGLPIGIVAGKAAYLDGIDGGMWRYGDASFPGAETTFFAGTFNKNPLTMAAARAVLAELKRRGPALQDNLNRRTAALVDRLNAVFGEQDVPLWVANFGSIFRFEFTGNLDVFFYHLLDRGIYLWEGRTCFLSTAHRESDTARVVEAVRSSIEEMRAGGFLPAGRRQPAAAGPGRSPRAPKPEVPELVRLGADGLEVKLAESRAEIARVQELRYHVFYGEMGAKPTPETAESHRDFDEFDELCDHLLVIERERGRVVGTYRLLRREAIGNHSFYSANEFDIAPVLAFEGEILELGRACVAQAYRNGTTMQLLWRGITAYARRHRVGLMFGCASLPGTDPRPVAEQLGYLYHYHLAPPGLRVQALPDRYVDMKGTDVRKIDPQRAIAGLPPLVRGYLRLGAFVGDGAVVDEQFNTTDVAIVLRTDWVTQDLDQLIAEGRLFAAQGLARGGQG